MGWLRERLENDPEAVNRIRGVLYGQAVGDALGVGAKFLTRAEVTQIYPNGLATFSDIVLMDHTRRWRRGEWTEATRYLFCVLDTLHRHDRIEPVTLARLLHARHGLEAPPDLRQVMNHPLFLSHPFKAAQAVHEVKVKRHGDPATNEALLRTSVIGFWNPGDPAWVKEAAAAACQVTHHDNRCADSCIALASAIACLVQGNTVEQAVWTAGAQTGGAFSGFFTTGIDEPISSYGLDDKDAMGQSTKALYAAFHALKHAKSFPEGLSLVIREGGDAPANGAVAGALLGARFGFSGIPEELVKGLLHRSELEDRLRGPVDDGAADADSPPDDSTAYAGDRGEGWTRWLSPIHLLFALNRGIIAGSKRVSRLLVSLAVLLTGWITEDLYFRVDTDGQEELVGFQAGETRDRAVLLVVLFLVLSLGAAKLAFFLAEVPIGKVQMVPSLLQAFGPASGPVTPGGGDRTPAGTTTGTTTVSGAESSSSGRGGVSPDATPSGKAASPSSATGTATSEVAEVTNTTGPQMLPPRQDGAVLADTSATDARMWPPRQDGAVLADTPATGPLVASGSFKATGAGITRNAVLAFVYQVFSRLDRQVPVEELLEILVDEGLEIRLPSARLASREDFRDWYKVAVNGIHSNTHAVESVTVRRHDDGTWKVHLLVQWDARPRQGADRRLRTEQDWTLIEAAGSLRIREFLAREAR